jgi:hypothetical protein
MCDETDDVAAFAADEAMEKLFLAVDGKPRIMFIAVQGT